MLFKNNNSRLSECYNSIFQNEADPPQGQLIVILEVSRTGELNELIVVEDMIKSFEINSMFV